MLPVRDALRALVLLAPLAALVPLSSSSAAPSGLAEAKAGTYSVDPLHSSAVFSIGHLGVSEFYGTFEEMAGSFELDPSDVTKSSIVMAIEPKSVHTRHPGRDAHVLNPDFLDAEAHPEMSFKSTRVARSETEGHLSVTGDMTLAGITKPITADVRFVGAAATMMGYRAGLVAEFDVDRFEFGMDALPEAAVGRTIHFVLSVEAALQDGDG
ncbi:MAG: YceI family protein [Planctomycetes bacterium]|nr:YceI family protein [Planctomycetota bacterium]